MINYNLKSHKILLFTISLILLGYVFSAFFFKVTNSNIFDIVPQGQIQLTFENNEFEDVNFELSGDNNWSLSTDDSYTGTNSIKSGLIKHDQTSTISLELNIIELGKMEFYYKVDSEYSTSGDEFYDGLYLYINEIYSYNWVGCSR